MVTVMAVRRWVYFLTCVLLLELRAAQETTTTTTTTEDTTTTLPPATTTTTDPRFNSFTRVHQHICCNALGRAREEVYASIPEAFNHTAIRDVQCTTVEGSQHIKRVGTSCTYCLCLFEDGGDFQRKPDCCSLVDFGQPGLNHETGYPICQIYKPTYSLIKSTVRLCELRYDLYPFASTARGKSILAALVVALASLAVFGVGALSQ
eukprot:TRINITY_DN7574_c0_g1_i1.p1 TRINITY_DN7574_c0_g1~~TRINITY_DN7574_c0_g1_i1.p1  ORF type:complete len:206 (-),score=23.28 TRINITY_DN7574_c0_g1_i1:341-958(-)